MKYSKHFYGQLGRIIKLIMYGKTKSINAFVKLM